MNVKVLVKTIVEQEKRIRELEDKVEGLIEILEMITEKVLKEE